MPRDDVLVDPESEFGREVRRRLQVERTIWLVTTAADGTPQPNPVWFLCTEPNQLLVYNRAEAFRLAHIRRRPRVAAHFNTAEDGNGVIVFSGIAEQCQAPPPDQNPDYLAKYGKRMVGVSGSTARFAADYPTPLAVHLQRVRGF